MRTQADSNVSAQKEVDAIKLRQTMGCFGTGITVITTRNQEGKPIGLTANSFTSVSLDPPLILFCIDKQAGSLDAFKHGDAFAVNILHEAQQDLSSLFASRTTDRFKEIAWETWNLEVPIIQNCLANLECQKHQMIDAGDHYIFIGKVNQVSYDPNKNPVLFFMGKYRTIGDKK